MPRRIHTPNLQAGEVDLAPAQARHLRDVLRLRPGDSVEAFDDAGQTAQALVALVTPDNVTLRVEHVTAAMAGQFAWTVAAALPKGPRADWMIEKLAELGTAVFVPLITERSVTHPAGKEKIARWTRLTTEAARLSGRSGVMRIEPLTPLQHVVQMGRFAWYLSPQLQVLSIKRRMKDLPPPGLTLLVGPEGGWTDGEIETFHACGALAVRLAQSTLRVETAAIAAAAIMAAWALRD